VTAAGERELRVALRALGAAMRTVNDAETRVSQALGRRHPLVTQVDGAFRALDAVSVAVERLLDGGDAAAWGREPRR